MILPVLEPGPRRSPYIAVGTEIGSYRIEAYLDRGGMASVYEATDLRLTRKVALKVLTEELLLTFSWVNFESPRVCRRLRLLGKMGCHVEKIWELPEGAAGPCCSDGGGGPVGACFGVGGHRVGGVETWDRVCADRPQLGEKGGS